MEALKRYRTGGQQKVMVEHVTVQAGGQAIVGNVSQVPGGGSLSKNSRQPHEQCFADAVEPTLPCAVQADEGAVPSSGGPGMERLPISWGAQWRPERHSEWQL